MNYFYDKEADVFYFSQGTPRTRDEVVEADHDVIVRRDPKTKEVRGFTLLNASRQQVRRARARTPLPFSLLSV